MSLLTYLAFALLGGLVLNVMPCVLPVLTLKAFTVFEHSTRDPKSQRVAGVGYAVGTMTALSVLGAVIVAIKASGKAFGWGMQFQQPAFVATLIAVIVAFALNALGVFELEVGGAHEEQSGFAGAVVNGWFAAVMATPCSAPFLGSAAAFALAADTPAWVTIAIFATIGLGLALPFTLLTFMPWLSKRLPKPGPWMDTFKKVMGFSLLATAVWLLGTFLRQVTPQSAQAFLVFLLAMSFTLWLVGAFAGLDAGAGRRWALRALAALVSVGGMFVVPLERARAASAAATPAGDAIAWVEFDPGRIGRELAAGRPVFLDYTADWCASCKTNDKLFVDTPRVREALARTGVVPVKVDMTNEDDVKEAWLKRTGRNDLPVYVVFLPGGGMDLLPVVITSETLTDAFERAAKKHPPQRTN